MLIYQRALTRVILQTNTPSYARGARSVRCGRCSSTRLLSAAASNNDSGTKVGHNSAASFWNGSRTTRALAAARPTFSACSHVHNYEQQPSTCLSRRSSAATARTRSFSTAAAALDDEDTPTPPPSAEYTIQRRRGIRNVAIVAHVDHGKTTLVDELLKVAASSAASAASATATDEAPDADDRAEGEGERLMDSGELEKERGITITSKVTRLAYTAAESDASSHIINVVDTPGHADFAGEVDRILSTVDGVVLVVDAGEGPKSQTKYVLSRALALGLQPIVLLNKADRAESLGRLESGQTEMELMDLFENLNATAAQMEYRTLFGSARGGWVTEDVDVALAIAHRGIAEEGGAARSMRGLLDAILTDIPAPTVHWYGDADGGDAGTAPAVKDVEEFAAEPFSMAANTVGYDPYLGRTCTGRIYSGQITMGDGITLLRRRDDDADAETSNNSAGPSTQVAGVFANIGVSRAPLDPPVAAAGDIVTLAGVPDAMRVGDTLTATGDRAVPAAVDTPPLAPPTLSCFFGANNGPLSGLEGKIVASSQVRARLVSETDNNVTLAVEKCETDAEKTVVLGRGELQIGILVEQMRREGYEMILTPPQILTTTCPDTGCQLEPWEEVIVDVDAEHSGTVVNALTGARRGVLVEMSDDSQGKTRLSFEVASRGLLGFGPEIATATRGTAIMHHCYLEDREHAGTVGRAGSDQGRLVSNATGKATLFALGSLSSRGTLFVAPGDTVYPGMVVGENSKAGDLEVNPVKAKKLDNMRTQSKEEKVYLTPPKRLSVEELIGYMQEDEVIEVTPLNVRLRKLELDAGVRKRAASARKKRMDSLKQNDGKKKKK